VLKVVILGYGELAQSLVLGVLKSRHSLVGVMRWHKNFIKDIFIPDGLLSIMKASNTKEINAQRANSNRFIKEIKKLKPDVIIVGSWGEIIKKEIIELPKVAFINCHPSLLPKHRGSNPYSSVIREGETETGVTFHLMDKKIDAGDILLQGKVPILEDDTAAILRLNCAIKAKDMVGSLLDGLEKAEIIPKKQNEQEASYYPPRSDNDFMINWNNSADFIHRQIRSLLPGMCCFAEYKDNFLMIKSTQIIELDKPCDVPGTVLEKINNNILVSCGDQYKAILLKDVGVLGFLSRLWSRNYLDMNLKIGSLL